MKNSYRFEGDKCYIYLRNIDKETVIDEEDFPIIDAFQGMWYGKYDKHTKSFYVYMDISKTKPDGKRTFVIMHRVILGLTDSKIYTDHKNHDTLNNARNNLCAVTGSENSQNRGKTSRKLSGYKGVYWKKMRQKWVSRIIINYKDIHLGYFNTPEEAHSAYQEAVNKYHPYMAKLKEKSEQNNEVAHAK